MKKFWKWGIVCLCLGLWIAIGDLAADKRQLSDGLVRLHVVGESNSEVDQQVKLGVKNAVVDYLRSVMEDCPDPDSARDFLAENLDVLSAVANDRLNAMGICSTATVQMGREAFPVRVYDSFTLPAGVYHSLRITIGEGEGRNWWCVVFPTLCFAATAEDLDAVAASAGFSRELTGAITGEADYEVRFFLLDALGRLENMFHR